MSDMVCCANCVGDVFLKLVGIVAVVRSPGVASAQNAAGLRRRSDICLGWKYKIKVGRGDKVVGVIVDKSVEIV